MSGNGNAFVSPGYYATNDNGIQIVMSVGGTITSFPNISSLDINNGIFRIKNNTTVALEADMATGAVSLKGGISLPITGTKTGAYTVLITDYTIIGDATSAGFTVTLPTAVGNTGKVFNVKKIDSSGNAVTIGTTSAQTIDGVTTKAISTQYTSITVQSNGTNWYII